MKKGKILGGMFLIAGSCIGAGMLAMPILTGLAGFFPSLITFAIAWIFMTFTGLLLVEANGWFKGQVNLVSMVGKALGTPGKVLSWILYLCLFYSLLVAYTSGSGAIFANFLNAVFDSHIPNWLASIFFVIILGLFLYFGTRPVDLFNRILMVGLIVTYFAMIILGLMHIQGPLFVRADFTYFFLPLPVLVISFGFHNMIPSLTAYLKGDLKSMRLVILGGSTIALAIYFVWSVLVIGVIPFGGPDGLLATYKQDKEAALALKSVLGSTMVTQFAQGFAFFAIITSFLAQGLSIMHFIADGIKVKPNRKHNAWLCLLALAPPLIFALSYPKIFFKTLSLAGGIFAVILFGIFPVMMAWRGRYLDKFKSDYHVSGGKISLILAGLFSIFMILFEISKLFGWTMII